ncbi:MAG: DUF559 domain-containing protein, partial [Solirubrobacteraceae bacterium]
IDLVVPRDTRLKLPGVHVRFSRTLTPADLRTRRGLPLTSPARTLLDLAEVVTERQLELALDRALVERTLRRAELGELLARTHSRRGTAALAALLEREGPTTVTRSEAEERLLALIRGAQLPEPAMNVRLHGYEVDFYWAAQKVVVEVDGFQFHSTRRRIERDHRKDATLQAAGITTIRVTWRQLRDEPYAVVARIAQALSG